MSQLPNRPRAGSAAQILAVGLALIVMTLLPANAQAQTTERRVALVIGNSNYLQAPALPNPKNDADDIAATLRDVGFEVIQATDVDKRGMDSVLARFNRAARGASVALFYFAGHGMQYNGTNYILPVDAQLEDDVGLRYETISLDQVRAAVDEASGVKILILDACRNNPLASKLARTVAGNTRNVPLTRGLARIEQTTGTVVAYATQANQVAEDGGGRNSPFTLALIENLRQPGVEIASLFRRVAGTVHDRTQGRQVPELSISLLSDFYLNQAETDLQAWSRISSTTDAAPLRDFITRFPNSVISDAARSRLVVVERAERDSMDRVAGDEKALRDRAMNDESSRFDRERLANDARERELRDMIAVLQRERPNANATAIAAAVSPQPTPSPAQSFAPSPAQSPAPQAAAPQILAALPTPAAVAAARSATDDPKAFSKFKAEMRRLGCYAAASDKDWNGASAKQALSLFAKQASLAAAPARLDDQQLDELQKRKARLCPSICNVRQVESGNGRCVAKTCGRGEMLDSDGDCIDRPSVRRAQPKEKPVARSRSIEREERAVERPVQRQLRERQVREPRPVRERVVAERRPPRRTASEPIETEYRRPCSPGVSFGIGFGPIRLATPLGRSC